VGSRSFFVLVDYTLFHHEEDVFRLANVLERIPRSGDNEAGKLGFAGKRNG
jgi:hypothetical protein